MMLGGIHLQMQTRMDLQNRQQQLQNQLILLKSSGDAAAVSEDAIKVTEEQLEGVSKELQTSQPEVRPSALERLKGQRDMYVPSTQVSAGRYEPAGAQGIRFTPYTEGSEITRADTGAVDQTIRTLKERQSALEEKVSQAERRGDTEAAERLQRQLQSVQSELQQKDNDAYRKQHTQFMDLVS